MAVMNHFDRLNLSVNYSIDFNDLDKHYFLAQVTYHPDKASSDEEKQRFLDISINLNEAYKTLKDDYARALYLLKLKKIDLENYSVPSEILEEIWQDRGEIEGLLQQVDLARKQSMECQSSLEVETFRKKQEQARQKLIQGLHEAFANEDYHDAAIKTIELKYLTNLIHVAKQRK